MWANQTVVKPERARFGIFCKYDKELNKSLCQVLKSPTSNFDPSDSRVCGHETFQPT